MAATVLRGKKFMVFVNGEATALATSHSLRINTETSDTSTKDHGLWGATEVTRITWEATTEALVTVDSGAESFDSLYATMIAGSPVTLKIGVPANYANSGVPSGGWSVPTAGYYTGSALITSLDRNDPNNEDSSFTATFTGVGDLTFTAG